MTVSITPMREVVGVYNSLTEDELANLGIVLGAYRSFRGNRRAHVVYVSMPITSGRRLVDVLTEEGVRTVEELAAKCGKGALWERVMQPNIVEGVALADRLGRREDLLFIAPSVFEAKKWRWTQEAYMSLWYRVIGEMAGKLVVKDGWEYSNGGVDEVLFAFYLGWRVFNATTLKKGAGHFNLQNFLPGMTQEEIWVELEAMWKMRVFDERGKEIRLADALKMCVDAIFDLKQRDLPHEQLLCKAGKMKSVWAFTPRFYDLDEEEGLGRIIDNPVFKASSERIAPLLRRIGK